MTTHKIDVTPSNRPYASFSASRQTRIETIQGRPPGTCLRVENEVIPLHNSPQRDPQNRYIYSPTPRVKITNIHYKDPNHLENVTASEYGQDANGAKSPEE